MVGLLLLLLVAYQCLSNFLDIYRGQSCWLGIQGPTGQLCNISVEPHRLSSINVCCTFLTAWGMGILEPLALLLAMQCVSWCGHAFL